MKLMITWHISRYSVDFSKNKKKTKTCTDYAFNAVHENFHSTSRCDPGEKGTNLFYEAFCEFCDGSSALS